MPQSLSSIYVHLVFSTKHRQPWISNDIRTRLYGYLGGLLRQRGASLLIVGGTDNHIHLLISLGRTVSLADLVRDVKSISSGWVNKTFPDMDTFAWQAGYAAFGVGYRDVETVERYIRDQERHHVYHTFEDELVGLLRAHRISYDETYLWE